MNKKKIRETFRNEVFKRDKNTCLGQDIINENEIPNFITKVKDKYKFK